MGDFIRSTCSSTSTIVGAIWLLIILALSFGWVWNIVKLAHSSFDPLTAMVVLRGLGVIMAPVGAVLGFL